MTNFNRSLTAKINAQQNLQAIMRAAAHWRKETTQLINSEDGRLAR
jgi:hypothetical protein